MSIDSFISWPASYLALSVLLVLLPLLRENTIDDNRLFADLRQTTNTVSPCESKRNFCPSPGFSASGADVRPSRGLNVLGRHREHFPADAVAGRVHKREAQAETEHAVRDHQRDRAERQQHLRSEETAFRPGRA